jgi:hypothetical protein
MCVHTCMFVGCPFVVCGYFRISFLRLFRVKNVMGEWSQFSTYPELWMFHTVVQLHMHERMWLFSNRPVWCDSEKAWCMESKDKTAMIFVTPPTVNFSKVFNRLFPCITYTAHHKIDILQ